MTTPARRKRKLHPGTFEKLMQVLALIAEGQTNPAMARQLGISEDTLKSRVVSLFALLDARDRAHAVSLGYQRGYLKVEVES